MKFIWSVLTRKQTTLGSAAFVLMAMVIVSGLLGILRLRLLYSHFTAEETGVFFASFRLPNLIFELLSMGTITAAFIPVFTKYLTKDRTEEAYRIAATVINISTVVMFFISVPVFIFSEELSHLLAPGFTSDQITVMAQYTRFMVIFQVIPLVIGNFFTGILQSYSLFIISSLAPIMYNAGIILGILLFSSAIGLSSAVVGVVIGAVLFMLIQVPMIMHIGYRHTFRFAIKEKGVIEIATLLGPRIIGLGVSQIDTTVDLMLSSLLGSKMVSVFFLAQSLQQLPVRLFGSAISQAVLPMLSAASANEDHIQFRKSLLSAIHLILFFILPASLYFVVLRIPIIRLIYGGSRFDWEATVLTALTFSAFSISLTAQSLSQVFIRAFYALYDSKIPMIVGIITIIINGLMSLLFILYIRLPVWSLGLSASIAGLLNMLLLFLLLIRRIGSFSFADLVNKPLKIFFASCVSTAVMYIPFKVFDQLIVDTTRVFGLIFLTCFVSILGGATYLFLSWVLDISEVQTIFAYWNRLKRIKTLFVQPSVDLVSGEVNE